MASARDETIKLPLVKYMTQVLYFSILRSFYNECQPNPMLYGINWLLCFTKPPTLTLSVPFAATRDLIFISRYRCSCPTTHVSLSRHHNIRHRPGLSDTSCNTFTFSFSSTTSFVDRDLNFSHFSRDNIHLFFLSHLRSLKFDTSLIVSHSASFSRSFSSLSKAIFHFSPLNFLILTPAVRNFNISSRNPFTSTFHLFLILLPKLLQPLLPL